MEKWWILSSSFLIGERGDYGMLILVELRSTHLETPSVPVLTRIFLLLDESPLSCIYQNQEIYRIWESFCDQILCKRKRLAKTYFLPNWKQKRIGDIKITDDTVYEKYLQMLSNWWNWTATPKCGKKAHLWRNHYNGLVVCSSGTEGKTKSHYMSS